MAVARLPTSWWQAASGDLVSYVVTRNINYTNVVISNGFCASPKAR
jgi:2-iminoacetate synthase ThiH